MDRPTLPNVPHVYYMRNSYPCNTYVNTCNTHASTCNTGVYSTFILHV